MRRNGLRHVARAEALALAAEVGHAEASRRTGIKAATLRSWALRAARGSAHAVAVVEQERPDVQVVDVEPIEAEHGGDVEVLPPGSEELLRPGQLWPERRPLIVAATSQAAAEALVALRTAVAANDGRRARDLAVTFGVLVDKGQLLAGEATSRSDERRVVAHVDARSEADVAGEIAALRRELGMPKGGVG